MSPAAASLTGCRATSPGGPGSGRFEGSADRPGRLCSAQHDQCDPGPAPLRPGPRGLEGGTGQAALHCHLQAGGSWCSLLCPSGCGQQPSLREVPPPAGDTKDARPGSRRHTRFRPEWRLHSPPELGVTHSPRSPLTCWATHPCYPELSQGTQLLGSPGADAGWVDSRSATAHSCELLLPSPSHGGSAVEDRSPGMSSVTAR